MKGEIKTMFNQKFINSIKEYFNKLEKWEERLDESIKSLKDCLEKTEADIKEINKTLDLKLEERERNVLKETKNRLSGLYIRIFHELMFLEAIKEKGFLNQNPKETQQVKEVPEITQVKENTPIEINYNGCSIKISI